jgi:hypothetical protein
LCLRVGRLGHLAPEIACGDDGPMAETLVNRDEVVGMLFAIADLNAKVLRIVEILEAEFGGEQGLSEDDA